MLLHFQGFKHSAIRLLHAAICLRYATCCEYEQKAVTKDELLGLIDEAAADGRPTLDLAGMEIDELPLEIGKLTKLKTLVLGLWDKKRGRRGNNLKTLPDEIGQLTELRSLFLGYNQFSELPEVIGELRKLRSLDLGSNQLSTLPKSSASSKA